MKKVFILIPAVLSLAVLVSACRTAPSPPSSSAPSTAATAAWARVPRILKHIRPPEFPAHDFVITDYGAVAGGEKDCTLAIAAAVDACAAGGGGHVVVPDGTFLTGPIHLRSNVDLHLAGTNSVLKFSVDPNAYLPAVFTRFEGT